MDKIGRVSRSVLILCGVSACSGGADDDGTLMQPSTPGMPSAPANASMNTAGAAADPATEANAEPGLHRENGALVFRTEPITIDAGEERYVCWALSTEEALNVQAVEFAGASGVHHLTFAQTVVPEPEGISECEVLLKQTWRPLFSAGAGANRLSLPAGVAHVLSAGTQLLVQLHLLNVTDEAITEAYALAMETTDEPGTQPVQIGGFGSFRISLPPRQQSKVQNECNLSHSARVVALMPHMHQLATSMTFELGTSADDAQMIYARDPWSFDQQTIDNVDMMLEQGKYARVTCNYDNTTDQTVTYGESSFNEMCFLGAFWVGAPINCVAF